jgi:hypothetical protein
MNQDELKPAYDHGFLLPLIQTGVIAENFEKTAEEKGRAVDTLQNIVSMGEENSTLLKTAYEVGQKNALMDMGLMSRKEGESIEKTASEDATLANNLRVVNTIKEYLVKSAEGPRDDIPPISGGEDDTASQIGRGALGAGRGALRTGAGYVGGSILGGLGGGALGGLGSYLLASKLAPNHPLLQALAAGGGALGLGSLGAGYGGLLGALKGGQGGLRDVQEAVEPQGQIDPRMLQGI